MNRAEAGCEDVDWIHLTVNKVAGSYIRHTIINFRVLQKGKDFLSAALYYRVYETVVRVPSVVRQPLFSGTRKKKSKARKIK
jgi:hypothetical protein